MLGWGMPSAPVRKGVGTAITNTSDTVRRIQEMGLTVGTTFRVVKVAPFGDPVEIDVRGSRLAGRVVDLPFVRR